MNGWSSGTPTPWNNHSAVTEEHTTHTTQEQGMNHKHDTSEKKADTQDSIRRDSAYVMRMTF